MKGVCAAQGSKRNEQILLKLFISSSNTWAIVKALVFPVVRHGYESGTIKKAEHRRIVLLNCGFGENSLESLGLQGDPTGPLNIEGNQSSVFIGRTDAEAETPILGHLMQRTDSFEKTLMLGKIEGRRRRG